MTRILGQNIMVDMVVLWAIETMACFCGVYFVMAHGHASLVLNSPALQNGALRAANLALLLGGVCFVLGLYKPTAILQPRMLFLTAGCAAFCAVPLFWITFGFQPGMFMLWGGDVPSPLVITLYWLLLLVGTRLLFIVATRSGFWLRHVMVVADGSIAQSIATKITDRRSELFRVSVVSDGDMSLATRRNRPWRVVTTPDHDEGVGSCGGSSGRNRRRVDIYTFLETQFGRIDLQSLSHPSQLAAIRQGLNEGETTRIVRRTVDLVISTLLLLLTAPVMAITAIAVKLDSPGPLIYSQERVGLDGRTFVILKFRSMRQDAERDGKAVWASIRDHRVTRVGSFIRKVRIDELPQLVNILRGDMSLVGPRPERPCMAAALEAEIPYFHLRTSVKPGLTGWAQINAAYTASAAEARDKLSYDLYYAKNRTLAMDLMIIVATIRILIFQVGSR